MQAIVDRLKLMRHHDSTKQNYYTVWKLFSKFLLRLDHKPKSWHDRLTLFIGHLVNEGKQSSTVHSYISAIKNVLRDDGFKIQEDGFLILALTRASKLKNDRVRMRLLIGKDLLGIILKNVYESFMESNQPYLSILYHTLFSTAYFGLFRVGELTSGTHPVLAKDVQIASNKRKLIFILRSSKTHNKGSHPQLVKISSTNFKSNREQKTKFRKHELPCLYQLLRDYARARGPYKSDSEAFFVFRDNSPVSPQHMRSCL